MAGLRRRGKNPHAEADQFRRRAVIGFAVVGACLVALAAWYFKLQVIDHDDYATRSEANRIRPRPVVPGRGTIYDRNGRLLAENVPAFRLDVTPDKVKDPAKLVADLGRIIALSPEDIAFIDALMRRLGLPPCPAGQSRRLSHPAPDRPPTSVRSIGPG